METTFKKLALRQLDRALTSPNPVVPSQGWLNRVRRALGLSQARLAERMGISQQALDRMEKREARRKVTIETLAEAAAAMDAKLVYFLVPAQDASFEALLKRRARAAAEAIVARGDRHMILEDQRISAEALEEEIKDVTDELFRTFSVEIWEE